MTGRDCVTRQRTARRGARRSLAAAALIVCSAGFGALPVLPARAASPDFSVSFTPIPNFNPGAQARFTATVTPLNGEAGPVTVVPVAGYGIVGVVTADPPVAVVGAPSTTVSSSGWTATFTLTANAWLTASTTYNEYVTAEDANGNFHGYNLPFTLSSACADFNLAPSTTSVTLQQGTSGSLSVGINAINGHHADVTVSAQPNGDGPSQVLPYGQWTDGQPAAGTPATKFSIPAYGQPYPTQHLQVTVPAQTAPGTYTLAVTGASPDSCTATHAFTLTVNVVTNSSLPTFTVSLSNCSTFNPGSSTQFSATISPSGETLPITLVPSQGVMQVSPAAAPVTGPPYATQWFTVSQHAKVPSTSQTITVRGVDVNGVTYSAQTTCASSTTPADFTISPTQSTVTVAQGNSVSDAVTISGLNSMADHIEMTVVPTTVPSTTGAQPLATWNTTPPAPVIDVTGPSYGSPMMTIVTTPEVAVGTYTLRVDATSANASSVERTASITVNVVPGTGDFRMQLSSGPTFSAGGRATFTATITPQGNESVPITLVPVQSAAQITPAVVPLVPPVGGSFTGPITQTFTITSNAHDPVGQALPVEVVAMDGHGFTDVESTTYTLTAPAADFGISASPSSLNVPQTRSGSVGVYISSISGMYDDVQLTVSPDQNNPSGAAPVATWMATNSPVVDVSSTGPPQSPSYPTQTLNFATVASTPLGRYHYVVSAVSDNANSATHTTDVYVTVTSGALDFSVSFSGSPSFNPGTTATITATVNGINQDGEQVVLVPDQGAVTVTPQQATASPGQSVTFHLDANANVPPCNPCTFTLTAVGQQTAQAHRPSTPYTLTSTPTYYTLSASPASLTLQPGAAGTTTVSITPQNQMSADVQLTVIPASDGNSPGTMPIPAWRDSGGPVEAVASPYTAGRILTFTDPPTDRGGRYHYLVIATSANAHPATQALDLYVTVPWPSFTLSAPPLPPINPGSSQKVTVSVSPVNGSTSPVALIPQQGLATVSPAAASLTSSSGSVQFTFSVPAITPAGTYDTVLVGVDQLGNVVTLVIPVTVTSSPTSFSLSASPGTTHPGASVTVPVVVWPHDGFASDVELAVIPSPAVVALPGPVATWSNGTPVIDAPASSTQALTFSVPSATPPGVYHYHVAGASANAVPPTYVIDVWLTVVAPIANGFTLSAQPGPVIDPGGAGTVAVNVIPGPSETSPVTVYAAGVPGTTMPSSVTVYPPYTTPATFRIALPAQTPPAAVYTEGFLATDGNQNAGATSTTYSASSTPTAFTLTVNPPAITALAGEANPATTAVQLGGVRGFSSPVTLTVVPAATTPPGVQPRVNWASSGAPVLVNAASNTAQTINVVASSNVVPGVYHYTVIGTSTDASPPVQVVTLDVTVPAPGGSPGAPSVSSVAPSSGPLTGGTTVTVVGSNFVPGLSSVLFGNVPSSAVVVSSPAQLTATTPANCAGTYDLRVVTPAGASPMVPEDHFTFTGQPTITSVSPALGTASSSTTVVVTGTGLGCPGTATVSGIGGLSAAILSDPANPNTASQVSISVPPQPNGRQGDIHISTPGGTSATVLSDLFGWHAPAPTLNSVSPSFGPSAGGTAVGLTGQFFSFATAVSFGSQAATYTVKSDTQITAVAPPGCGTVPVRVTTAAGLSLSATFTYVAGVPTVGDVAPHDGPIGGGASVVVRGSNLGCATGVSFNGQAVPSFHVDSDGQITTTAPPGQAGVVDVTVANAVGTSATGAAADSYQYEDVPTVSSVVPDAGPVGGGTGVTLSGQNFTGRATVTFGGTQAPSVIDIDPVTLDATTPPGSSGPVDVIVSDGGGSSPRSATARFFYGPPVPSAVSPAAGPASGGIDVQITGSNFAPDTTVSFGSQQVAATVLSSTLIDVPSAPAGTPGSTVTITLQDPGGTGSSGAVQYTFAYRPVVSSITPTSGGASGGTAVTITGDALSVTPTVFFGSVSASSVTVNQGGTITAVSPPGVAGSSVIVTVRTPGGTSDSGNRIFSYQPPPSGSMAPLAGPLAGGTPFTISGSGFFGSPTVTFGGVAATGVTLVNSTTITGNSPAASSPGTVAVVLTTGSGSTTVGSYAYDPIPTLTALSTNAGPAQGDSGTAPSVTISGTGFLHGVTVSFGSITVTPTSVNPAGTSLVVVPPVQPRGVVQVVVNAAGGSTSNAATPRTGCGITAGSTVAQYAYGAPAVQPMSGTSFAVTPPGGPTSGASVTICGSNFVPGATVTIGINGSAATNVQVVNPNTITATLPSSPTSGAVDVVVTTAQSLTSGLSSADQFLYGAPVLTGINPAAGPASGQTSVTLAVSNFVNDGVSVTVGGVPVAITGIVPPINGQTTLTITMPSNSTTSSSAVSIVVTTDAGSSNAQTYTYWAPPTVTGVSLTSGPTVGGRTVTVTGSNFVAGNIAVSFGGVPGTSISPTSSTSLTVVAPAHAAGTVDVQVSFTTFSGTSAVSSADRYEFMDQGYWIAETNGAMHAYGSAASVNWGGPTWSSRPISGMAQTPDAHGYWVTAQDGGVFTFGDAGFYGSLAGQPLNAPVVGIAATPSGHGYWLLAADGGVFTFGDAAFFGSMGGQHLNRPMSGMATTTNGGGYWLVAQDGGIFPYGNAPGLGAACCLSAPFSMVGIASPGNGYWEVESDGNVYCVGVVNYGHWSGALNRPMFGMAVTPSGQGYVLFAQDGGVFTYGDAAGLGSAVGSVGSTAIAAAEVFAA